MTPRHRAPLRALLALSTAAALALALPATAAAHVTVRPDDPSAGSWGKLTFRVPNESDTAGTVGLTVTFPRETPFAFVSVKPHAGWDVEVTREALDEPVEAGDYTLDEIVTAITWTARDGTQIAPGQFDEFDVSVGPLPQEDMTIELPADQLYSDGEVVSWSQPSDDHSEGSKPAPAFAVTAGADDGHGGTGHDDEEGSTAEPVPTSSDDVEPQAASSADGDDTAARALAALALVLGGAGLGVAVASLRRGRTGA